MVRVRFIKSGVAYGYAYNFGETGVVRPGDVDKLQSLGVVEVLPQQAALTTEKPKYETPEAAKPKYETRRKK